MTGEIIQLHDRRPRPLHMMTEAQRDAALADIKASRHERDGAIGGAYGRFNDKIRGYEAAGIPVSEIAEAAGLTRARIYQIIKELPMFSWTRHPGFIILVILVIVCIFAGGAAEGGAVIHGWFHDAISFFHGLTGK